MENLNQELNQEKKPTIIVISIIAIIFIAGLFLGFNYVKKFKTKTNPYKEVINKTYTKEDVLSSMEKNEVKIENPAISKEVLNSLSGVPPKNTKSSKSIKK
ncbi:MAG: hypothetical protein EXS49_01875 [Candidatus Pacebacteria bacterium]|nr:hypothetical protein [Candidatus Paceibacterota bacterium]